MFKWIAAFLVLSYSASAQMNWPWDHLVENYCVNPANYSVWGCPNQGVRTWQTRVPWYRTDIRTSLQPHGYESHANVLFPATGFPDYGSVGPVAVASTWMNILCLQWPYFNSACGDGGDWITVDRNNTVRLEVTEAGGTNGLFWFAGPGCPGLPFYGSDTGWVLWRDDIRMGNSAYPPPWTSIVVDNGGGNTAGCTGLYASHYTRYMRDPNGTMPVWIEGTFSGDVHFDTIVSEQYDGTTLENSHYFEQFWFIPAIGKAAWYQVIRDGNYYQTTPRSDEYEGCEAHIPIANGYFYNLDGGGGWHIVDCLMWMNWELSPEGGLPPSPWPYQW